MAEIFESPKPLDQRHISVIEAQIQKGAHAILNGIEDHGSFDYYVEVREQVLPEFKYAAQLVSDTLQQSLADVSNTAHPFAQAIKRGIVVGSVLGTEALRRTERVEFLSMTTDTLDTLVRTAEHSPYDLEEIMRRGGSTTRKALMSRTWPELFDYGLDDDDERRDLLYANTMGYMGALAITNFTRLRIKRSLARDRKAENEMLNAATRLSHPDTMFTVEDIQSRT